MRMLFTVGAVALFAVLLTGCEKKEVAPTPVPPPAESVLKSLARETLLMFEQALKDDDFTDYYNAMSREYASQILLDVLAESYKPAVEAGYDLSEVATVEPIITVAATNFRKPSVQRNQIIVFEGEFPINPKPVIFKLRYVHEDFEWKLFTHTIKVQE